MKAVTPALWPLVKTMVFFCHMVWLQGAGTSSAVSHRVVGSSLQLMQSEFIHFLVSSPLEYVPW